MKTIFFALRPRTRKQYVWLYLRSCLIAAIVLIPLYEYGFLSVPGMPGPRVENGRN